jgi:hypothetical protein
VLGLLEGLPDDGWVYWCIDDKYPIWIDLPVVRRTLAALDAMPPQVAGLCCSRRLSARRERAIARPHDGGRLSEERADCLRVAGLRFRKRTDYKRIWLHQFLRVRVLRGLFGGFPEIVAVAKKMDDLIEQAVLPPEDGLYVLDRNAMVFGESTHRGMLTLNCAESLGRERGVPEGFEIAPKRMVIGRRPPWVVRLADRVIRSIGDVIGGRGELRNPVR